MSNYKLDVRSAERKGEFESTRFAILLVLSSTRKIGNLLARVYWVRKVKK